MKNHFNKYILYKTKYLNLKYNNIIGGYELDDIKNNINLIRHEDNLCFMNSIYHILALINPFVNYLNQIKNKSQLVTLLLSLLKYVRKEVNIESSEITRISKDLAKLINSKYIENSQNESAEYILLLLTNNKLPIEDSNYNDFIGFEQYHIVYPFHMVDIYHDIILKKDIELIDSYHKDIMSIESIVINDILLYGGDVPEIWPTLEKFISRHEDPHIQDTDDGNVVENVRIIINKNYKDIIIFNIVHNPKGFTRHQEGVGVDEVTQIEIYEQMKDFIRDEIELESKIYRLSYVILKDSDNPLYGHYNIIKIYDNKYIKIDYNISILKPEDFINKKPFITMCFYIKKDKIEEYDYIYTITPHQQQKQDHMVGKEPHLIQSRRKCIVLR